MAQSRGNLHGVPIPASTLKGCTEILAQKIRDLVIFIINHVKEIHWCFAQRDGGNPGEALSEVICTGRNRFGF